MKIRDLGLDYMAATHGVQSAIRYELEQKYPNGIPHDKIVEVVKHLRVGIDMSKADQAGLAGLLIKKRIFTAEEYIEHMRLAANEELARYKEHLQDTYGLSEKVDFR